ncbi:MAG: YIP1 family protein [Pseudomonadota bacterium]
MESSMGREHGFLTRIVFAWSDLRASMRAVLDSQPGEGRLLMFAVLSGLIIFAARAFDLTVLSSRGAISPELLRAEFARSFFALVLARTLGLYGVAAIARIVARSAGGTGSWRETRAAIFWASLVSAPVRLLSSLLMLLPLPAILAQGVIWLAPSAFAVVTAYCLAETHGFSRVWVVFLVVAGITLALIGSILALAA